MLCVDLDLDLDPCEVKPPDGPPAERAGHRVRGVQPEQLRRAVDAHAMSTLAQRAQVPVLHADAACHVVVVADCPVLPPRYRRRRRPPGGSEESAEGMEPRNNFNLWG